MLLAHRVVICMMCLSILACAARANTSLPVSRSAGVPAARAVLPKEAVRPMKMVTLESQPTPARLTEIPKWYRVLDPLSTYYFHPEQAPKGYRPLPERIRSPFFPGREFSEIWGFDIGQRFELAANCEMLAHNGTPCGNVLYPGRRLDDAQTSQLMSIARHPLDEYEVVKQPNGGGHSLRRARMRCGDEPVAMFVFYDASHRPVGVVGVDEECSQWNLWPAPKDGWDGLAATLEIERRILRQLCLGLDLQRCMPQENPYFGLSAKERDATITVERRALLPLLLREWPPVDETKTLANVSNFERERLCAWYERSAALAVSLFSIDRSWSFSGASYEDEEAHKAIQLEGLEDCVKNFPRCSSTVGNARACITQHLEHFWDRYEACHEDCTFGIKTQRAWPGN